MPMNNIDGSHPLTPTIIKLILRVYARYSRSDSLTLKFTSCGLLYHNRGNNY